MSDAPLIRIVDDDEELLRSQKLLLESLGWEVVTYSSGVEFLERDALKRAGCVVLDVRMPGLTGLEVQQIMLEKGVTHIAVIFLTAHGDVPMAVHTMQHGAVDFVQKPVDPHYLLEKVSHAVVRSVEKSVRLAEVTRLKGLLASLSPREREVAERIGRGLTNKEIARELGIEESTVKMHRSGALAKLQVKNSAQLVRVLAVLEYEEA